MSCLKKSSTVNYFSSPIMKNWKVLVVFGSIWLLSHAGFAQEQLELQRAIIKKAQYEMLKKCLEYLATEPVSKEPNANSTCADCYDFNQIKNYARKNVKGGVKFVNENSPEDVSNVISEDLTSYKDNLINRLTTGKPERTDRAATSTFNTLTSSLNKIENGAKGELRLLKSTPPRSQANDNQGANNSGTRNTPLDNAKVATIIKEILRSEPLLLDSAKVATIVKDVVKSEPSLTDYLPYLLSLLNLCLVAYLLYKSSKRQNRNSSGLERDLHKRINTAEEDINSNSLKTQSLMDRIYKLETNLENLRRQVNNQNNNGDKLRVETDVATSVQSGRGFYVQPDSAPTPALRESEKYKYALYADLGDGFSVSSLSNQISADSLFEIKITSPTAAQLSVTQNESAQKMAFSDPYQYLRTTCSYIGEPGGRIRTNTPGELELVGNKWRIVTRAEISFYR